MRRRENARIYEDGYTHDRWTFSCWVNGICATCGEREEICAAMQDGTWMADYDYGEDEESGA